MSDEPTPEPRFLLTVLAALWLMAFTYSFVAARAASETAMGLSAGAEALGAFLGWQGMAGLFALAAFGVSRAWPKGSPTRRLGAVPLIAAGGLALGILCVIAYVSATA